MTRNGGITIKFTFDDQKPDDRYMYKKITGKALRKPPDPKPNGLAQQRPFIGIDGEGGNIPVQLPGELFPAERHRYLLLRAGDKVLENPDGITFTEAAEFLVELPRNGIYVGYFFDYDVTMMIKGLPRERAERLLNPAMRMGRNGIALPVDIGDYQIDYLPHKFFKIRKKMADDYWDEWFEISDVGTFFQSSFVKALKKWNIGDKETLDKIQAGKDMRADFAGVTDEIRKYNAMEIQLLQQLMEEFRAVCQQVGYAPRKWQGPGQLAAAGLRKHKISKHDELESFNNKLFRMHANAAYYGGRFEVTAHGPIKSKVWQYDINSAYPHIIRNLPCLLHGRWELVTDYKRLDWNGNDPFIADVKYEFQPGKNLYWFPARDKKGNINYPRCGTGTYWSNDIIAAIGSGDMKRYSLNRMYQYVRQCDCQPFDFMNELYRVRKELGKSNKGYALKLFMNSVYGKLAQSIGSAPYANPVWAGLITSGCRRMIAEACREYAEHVYMIATDGIFAGCEITGIPTGEQLGEWELTIHEEGIFIVQPGIYFLPAGDAKTRGIPFSRVHQKQGEFEEAWEQKILGSQHYHTAYVDVQVDNFISAKQALARNKWDKAGSWERNNRKVGFSWITKRQVMPYVDYNGTLRSIPYDGVTDLGSVDYKRMIGGNLRISDIEKYSTAALNEKMRMEEQPDWVTPFLGDIDAD